MAQGQGPAPFDERYQESNTPQVLCACCAFTEHPETVKVEPSYVQKCRRCGQDCRNVRCDRLRPNRTGTYGRMTRVRRRWTQ